MPLFRQLREVTWLVISVAIFSIVGVAIAVAAAYGLAGPKGAEVDTGRPQKDAQPKTVTVNKEGSVPTPWVQGPKTKTKAALSPPVAKPIAVQGHRASAIQTASAGPLDRSALTKELQRQLKRTGCYDGAINESGPSDAAVDECLHRARQRKATGRPARLHSVGDAAEPPTQRLQAHLSKRSGSGR